MRCRPGACAQRSCPQVLSDCDSENGTHGGVDGPSGEWRVRADCGRNSSAYDGPATLCDRPAIAVRRNCSANRSREIGGGERMSTMPVQAAAKILVIDSNVFFAKRLMDAL